VGKKGKTPPPEFAETAAELEKLGVELVWTWTYNAGSNPLALTVRAEHLERPEVRAPGGELEGPGLTEAPPPWPTGALCPCMSEGMRLRPGWRLPG